MAARKSTVLASRKSGTVHERRWRAIRALAEDGGARDWQMLADLGGVSVATVQERARREGWKVRLGSGRDRLGRLLGSQIAELEDMAVADAAPDKTRLEMLNMRIRAAEKLRELDSERGGPEQQEKSDAELAEILDRIDRRIVDLAREFAAAMAGRRDLPGNRGTPWG